MKEKIQSIMERAKTGGPKKPLAGILVLALAVALCYWAYPLLLGEQDVIEASGTIEATTINVTAKVAGTIESLNVRSGDQVQKGQLLAVLSRNDLVAQKERDELSVIKAETALADLLSGARVQEHKEAQANVNIAQANYRRAADDERRLKALWESGAVSQLEYEKAQANLEIARNQLAAAEARLSLLEEGSRAEVIKAAEIEVERNKAILKATEAMLADLQIVSPLDGVVASKNYEEGEYLQVGSPLLTIVQADDLWVKVYIPTDDLPYITLGQKVQVSVTGYPQTFEGVVEEIAAKGEFTPKTIQTKKERTNIVFAVKIRLPDQGGILKPGMPADVVIPRRAGQ